MSSFFSSIFSGIASTGPTGPTGSTGPDGPLGPTGNSAPGATGIGLSLGTPYSWAASTKILTQTLSDNSQSAISIVGPTGFYQARVFSFCTGCTNSIVSSSTQSSLLKSGTAAVKAPIAYGDVITLKNITTDTPEDIGITYTDISRSTISVTYTPKITGLSFSDASLGLIVKLGTGGTNTTVFGSTGSLYTPSIKTADFKVRSYQERVVNVYPDTFQPIQTSDALRWTLNIDGPTFASIFQLMPCNLPECRAGSRYINIVQTTPTPSYSKGITIIIPSGVTIGGPEFDCVSTLGTCTELPGILTTYFTYNHLTDGLVVKFPLSRPVCFTDGLDIINLISISNTWYGSYVGGFTAGTNVPYDPATMTIYNPSTVTELNTLCDGCGPLITYEGYICGITYNTFNGVACPL